MELIAEEAIILYARLIIHFTNITPPVVSRRNPTPLLPMSSYPPPPPTLPLELLLQISHYLETDIRTFSALSRICRTLHSLLSPFVDAYFQRYPQLIFASACKRGLGFTVRRCIAPGMHVYPETTYHCNQLLIWAAAGGDAEMMHALLSQKWMFNMNCNDMYGQTPLMQAVNHGRTEVVRALLENGARVQKWDIEKCMGENRKEIVELLSEHYVPVVENIEKKRKMYEISYQVWKVCRTEETGFDNHYPRWGK
ncbi:uncharacterized protein H6S33_008231 [Morchella sextelata]|uniref:uncharacterized protein n=1 Tax=Morchella sextelata TaxID=1174677 RepID=UPI001D03AD5A|nr:uncharacterized protein H6S33_008231 [Morchella sextelata]KAH0603227.1 hypothetical protein H6S33_008231 [Morchella sextelata]